MFGPRFRATVVPRSQTSFGETEAWTIVLGTWRMEKSKRPGIHPAAFFEEDSSLNLDALVFSKLCWARKRRQTTSYLFYCK